MYLPHPNTQAFFSFRRGNINSSRQTHATVSLCQKTLNTTSSSTSTRAALQNIYACMMAVHTGDIAMEEGSIHTIFF